ncbi:MAG: hypothetical protein PHQ86_07710 [Dehalococcoidales bacterium]|jgi:hypothetical protein|nr:hypothetical protein [Dehalococcoidales bacterium]
MELENIKIAWLAGLVDGEGSIGAYISKTIQRVRNGRIHKSVHVVYQFTIANTNELIIQEAHNIVSMILGNQTPATAIQVVADKRPERKNSRLGYCVNVKDHKSIIKILSVLEPYLIGKKSQAQVMLNLLKKHRPHTEYTSVELEVIELLKQMKKHNTVSMDGNAELNRESEDSRKCVEHIEATTQSEMDLS